MLAVRTDYKGKGKYRVIAEALNAIGRVLRGMVGYDGIRVELQGEEIRIFGDFGDDLAHTRRWGFGIVSVSHTDLTLDLNGSLVQGFSSYASIAAASTDAGTQVHVGGTLAAPHLVIAEGHISGPDGSIKTQSVAKSSYTPYAAGLWRLPLYEVYVAGGIVTVSQILHLGVVDLRTLYGKP